MFASLLCPAMAAHNVPIDAPGGDLMFGAKYEAMKVRLAPVLTLVQQYSQGLVMEHVAQSSKEMTFHTWLWEGLDNSTENAIRKIQSELVDGLGTHRSRVAIPLDSMDEFYSSAVAHVEGSDKVFVTPHMDGFFQLLPLASVKRCIYGVQVVGDDGRGVFTLRPFHPVPSQQRVVVHNGEAVCFDYNHDIHWIEESEASGDSCNSSTSSHCVASGGPRRDVLKFHFLEVPKALTNFGQLVEAVNSRYNAFARQLFLRTIDPDQGLSEAVLGHFVNAVTSLSYLELYCGYFGVFRVLFLVLTALSPSRLMPSLGISHYLLYIFVFVFRSTPLEVFMRDAFYLKSCAMVVVALCYAQFRINILSAIIAAAGFGLAFAAFIALGKEATYFGFQYGRPSSIVQDWPYGEHLGIRIPHPMILGSSLGLIGTCINSGFRRAHGRCILVHLILYAIVLGLEISDLHVPPRLNYNELFAEFQEFHRNASNVWAHVFTTGLGFLGGLGLLRALAEKCCCQASDAVHGTVFISFLFLSSAVYYHDPDVAVLSGIMLMVLGFLAVALKMSTAESLVVIAVGTVLQEASHVVFQEPAYMWSYFDGSGAAFCKLFLHTAFLCAFNIRSVMTPELKAFEGEAIDRALWVFAAMIVVLAVVLPYRTRFSKTHPTASRLLTMIDQS